MFVFWHGLFSNSSKLSVQDSTFCKYSRFTALSKMPEYSLSLLFNHLNISELVNSSVLLYAKEVMALLLIAVKELSSFTFIIRHIMPA